jgi:regulator of replication initiation timing
MNQEISNTLKINDLLHKVMDIKYDTQQVIDQLSTMDSEYEEQTGREQALESDNAKLREHKERLTALEVQLRDKNQGLYDDKAMLEKNVRYLRDENERFKREVADLKAKLVEDIPNMPTIPKDVAIAIFREGVSCGVDYACDELDNSTDIHIEESGYSGGFEVSFSKYIDLSEHLDLDWMRDKVGNYEEGNAIATLRGLCETKGFECRIHGIDEKKTPKIQ